MKNETIGIIGAMRVEMEALAAALDNKKTEVVSDIEFHIGSLSGHNVVLAVCGVGKVFAAMCAQTMILRFGATKIINTGVAAVPGSSFFREPINHLIRLHFAREDETLYESLRRLKKMADLLK